tara:strand:+ start:6764 stop:7003 length:240 start_codon:yes stop_codon:yes gene_type:complete
MLGKVRKIGAKIIKFVDDLAVAYTLRKELKKVCKEMENDQKVRFEKGEKLGGGVARNEYKVKRDSKGRFVKWEKIDNEH